MRKVPVRQGPRKRQPAHSAGSRSVGVWVRLPDSVVEARAGLIPSEETDGNPPPGGLTSKELLAWHRGLPVFLSAGQFLAYLRTARFSAWRRTLPVVLEIGPAQYRGDRPPEKHPV